LVRHAVCRLVRHAVCRLVRQKTHNSYYNELYANKVEGMVGRERLELPTSSV
jgi:hypothetical protein